MKRENIFALKITFIIIVLIILSSFVSSFLFSNFSSIFDFLLNIKKEFVKNTYKFLNVFLALIIISFWTYFILYIFWKKHFLKIDEYNKNLKDYNHYLAHELKTPISVIFSNLEVLKYGFNENIISKSQNELKNMINIIDVLLSFSETLNIYEKDNINLENFLKNYINTYFLENKKNIFIQNNEFNFYIETNQTLFKRIIRNLIENALKYSIDKKVYIKIENWKLIFKNSILNDFSEDEIEKLLSKFYRKDNTKNDWYWLWLAMIKEILKFLWYDFYIYSKDKNFFVEISFKNKKS